MSKHPTIGGQVMDDRIRLSLQEVCVICDSRRNTIIELVDEGIVEPAGTDPASWQFTGSNVARIRIVLRLQRDLDINLAGAALAIELLEEIERLRRRVRD